MNNQFLSYLNAQLHGVIVPFKDSVCTKDFDVLFWNPSFLVVSFTPHPVFPIRDWYFKLHLVNFLARLKETFENLDRWTERDRQDFLEHQDLSKVFIMPSVSGVKAKKLGRRKMG